jgi:dCMP deaminase
MMSKWDLAHMKSAENYAELSSARRLHVGCVIVKDNRIISIGYNGMPSGWDNNCEDNLYVNKETTEGMSAQEIKERFPFKDSKGLFGLKTKPEVLHAETNAIAKVARSNESCEGATLYTTVAPCLDCAKLIYQSGISKVYYRNDYPRGTLGVSFLQKCGIGIDRI